MKLIPTILRGKRIPLSCFMVEMLFLWLRVLPLEEYGEDGKRTGNIIGYIYEVVDCMNFEKYRIKIKGQTAPLMTNEELQHLRESGKKVAVEFIEPTVLLYWNNVTKTYEDSFSAKDVHLVEEE